MRKILIAMVFILISCNKLKEPDPCACSFNIDLVIKTKDKTLDTYRKFFDKDKLLECSKYAEQELNLTEEIKIGTLYNYYKKKCPSYNLEIEKN